MKISWGTGIVIAIALFIGFIMTMVIKMSTDPRADHEMVTDNYYAKELAYQEVIDAKKNASEVEVHYETTEAGLLLILTHTPETLKDVMVELYRADNQKLDIRLPLEQTGNQILVEKRLLVPGKYNLSIEYSHEGERYLIESPITY